MDINSLVGKRFNKLTVIAPAPSRNQQRYWICQCDCGNEIIVRTGDLNNGHTKSCGCLKRQAYHLNNIQGQRFGKLIALMPTEKRSSAHCVVWKCKCDCGNTCFVDTISLTSGNTTSCGCIKSIGEEKIASILNKYHIQFEQQKTFPTCRFENGYNAYFDFYINNQYLLEYDGIQHFATKSGGWNNEQNLLATQRRDKIKEQWCKNNNIHLIRIPYTHLNELIIDDLLLERSKYVII